MCSNCNKYVSELKKKERSHLSAKSRCSRLGRATLHALQPELPEARSRWLRPAGVVAGAARVRGRGRAGGGGGARATGEATALPEELDGGVNGTSPTYL